MRPPSGSVCHLQIVQACADCPQSGLVCHYQTVQACTDCPHSRELGSLSLSNSDCRNSVSSEWESLSLSDSAGLHSMNSELDGLSLSQRSLFDTACPPSASGSTVCMYQTVRAGLACPASWSVCHYHTVQAGTMYSISSEWASTSYPSNWTVYYCHCWMVPCVLHPS